MQESKINNDAVGNGPSPAAVCAPCTLDGREMELNRTHRCACECSGHVEGGLSPCTLFVACCVHSTTLYSTKTILVCAAPLVGSSIKAQQPHGSHMAAKPCEPKADSIDHQPCTLHPWSICRLAQLPFILGKLFPGKARHQRAFTRK